MADKQVKLSAHALKLRESLRMEQLPEGYIKRMEICRSSAELYRGPNSTNCIGTALFIVGERSRQSWDVAVDGIYDLHKYELRRMVRIQKPELGCLVAWLQPKREQAYYERMEKIRELGLSKVDYNMPRWMKPTVDSRQLGRFNTLHLGVITSVDPLLMAHRVIADGPFMENEPVSKVTEQMPFGGHKDLPVKVAFYHPYWRYSDSYSPIRTHATEPVSEEGSVPVVRRILSLLEKNLNNVVKWVA